MSLLHPESPSRCLQLALLMGLSFSLPGVSAQEQPEPLRALLIAGGCCHDYPGQHKVLSEGIQARSRVRVDVVWTDDRSTQPPLPLYANAGWAEGYDVISHDECAANEKDPKVLERILAVHQTIPAVHLHCAMHSFRTGSDDWFKHLGLQSTGHGPQQPIEVHFIQPDHPITQPLKDWVTIREELYNNVKLFDAEPLATGKQILRRNGEQRVVEHVVAWVNQKQGAPSFSTTLGHNTETVADPRYLDLVTRGLLWACGKLEDAYLQSYEGPSKVILVEKSAAPKVSVTKPATQAPENATLVEIIASSRQDGRFPWMAVDGNPETRWCADGASKPQWIQLSFEESVTLTGLDVQWETPTNVYGYYLESSQDGEEWERFLDASSQGKAGSTQARFDPQVLQHLRLTGTRSSGGWISLWELKVLGEGIETLYPKLSDAEETLRSDAYAEGGNTPPKMEPLSPEEEAAILQDASVADGFEMTLFASAQAANYPVYVAASPKGDLYVSSDGNGSLGRQPKRGRVLRLRDTDQDGRADEVTEFIPEVDSPRGLIWDHDRLYLLHPPHMSVFFDQDGDGIAEASQRLISGIAFDFDQRPPDHTTNGLELGVDGWIYIAGGDFGFMDAVGVDGRRLQHRGGGVIRVRPDGTGLELFATGTRNILGTPTSPLLDLFARDNTNDGGGWDIRLHHFSGLEDHGYPRLYMNFGDEHVQPLADYGGGSGCGSVYIHEPGFPAKWANAPYTCDWGRAATFHHQVQREGASFVETAAPTPFIKVTRPTDADVDGMSRIYQASWKGPATFNWAGPNHGYIIRVSPSGYEPQPLDDWETLGDAQLVAKLDTPSQVRLLAAQRSLLRRPLSPELLQALLEMIHDKGVDLRVRVGALYALTQRGVHGTVSWGLLNQLKPLISVPELAPFVVRALGDMGIDQVTHKGVGPVQAQWFEAPLRSEDPRTRLEAIIGAARQGKKEIAPVIAESLGHVDPVIAHTAFRALALLGASEPCFSILDHRGAAPEQKKGASFALMRMHQSDVVEGLLQRLSQSQENLEQTYLLAALCRLVHREAPWNGDSWGTRPDTRGPYYQLETWGASERILAALQRFLQHASGDQAAWLVAEMNRNRIQSDAALDKILDLALAGEAAVGQVVSQLSGLEDIPAKAIPLLIQVAEASESTAMESAQAVETLMKVPSAQVLPAALQALTRLETESGARKAQEMARRSFLTAKQLESWYESLESWAAKEPASPSSSWAQAGLLALADRKDLSPETSQSVKNLIDVAWQDPVRRVVMMRMAASQRNHVLDARIRAALQDPNEEVSRQARQSARRLRIEALEEDTSPRVDGLSVKETLQQVVRTQGDVTLGEAVFLRASCQMCHTVSQEQDPKGPYLGNIANTYRREDLAKAILMPGDTIAQGFATHVIELDDGEEVTGFVVQESGDQVILRDVLSQAHTLDKEKILSRKVLETSMMPEGLMASFSIREMASLLDYLEQLAP